MRADLGDEPIARQTQSSAPLTSLSTQRLVVPGGATPLLHIFLFLPFLGLLVWAGLFLNNARLDAQESDAERPVFSQMRPFRIDDLSPAFRAAMAARYLAPITYNLERHGTRLELTVLSRGKRVRQAPILPPDLDQETLLKNYRDRTGDQADTVAVKYKRGKPFVYIYSSSDMGE